MEKSGDHNSTGLPRLKFYGLGLSTLRKIMREGFQCAIGTGVDNISKHYERTVPAVYLADSYCNALYFPYHSWWS